MKSNDISLVTKKSCTENLKLPPNILFILQLQQQRFDWRGQGWGGDGGWNEQQDVIPPAAKRIKNNSDKKVANTNKPNKRDAWSAPEGVANPITTYFYDTADGNVNKTCFVKIKLKHHA